MDRREAFRMIAAGFAALTGNEYVTSDDDYDYDIDHEPIPDLYKSEYTDLGRSGVFDCAKIYNWGGITSVGVVLLDDDKYHVQSSMTTAKNLDVECSMWTPKLGRIRVQILDFEYCDEMHIYIEPTQFTWKEVNKPETINPMVIVFNNDENQTPLYYGRFADLDFMGSDFTVDFGDEGLIASLV